MIRSPRLAVAAGLCSIAFLSGAGVHAETPSLLWRDAARVSVACLVVTEKGVDSGPLHDRLCKRVTALAAAGSPIPVAAVSTGDRSMLAADTVTLLVQASALPTASGRVMAISIRPRRNVPDDAGLLFAAAPRAVMLDSAGNAAGLDAAVKAMLSDTLPWARSINGARKIVK